jgi:predicted DNA-binding transcriptional regulator AlpA
MGEQVSIKEAMAILGIKSKPTLYSLIARGLLHSHKRLVGRGRGGERVWFERAEVEQLVEAEEQPKTKPKKSRK